VLSLTNKEANKLLELVKEVHLTKERKKKDFIIRLSLKSNIKQFKRLAIKHY
jgi:hypothetical protein